LIIEKFEFSTPLKGRGQCIENKGLFEFCEIEILRKIDYLEGYREESSVFNFYERREIQIFTDKETFTAWAYFLNKSKIIDSGGELIASGVWSNYRY